MQTRFSLRALADPEIAESEKILRACVHCGFCTATCPTYLLTGDELDSPRGRIYLIKEMLEKERPADARTAHHIDRCLSCLSCMTTCPSGVHYMHLVDHARAHIEKTFKRPATDRALRATLAHILPRPDLFRRLMRLGVLAKSFARLLPKSLAAPLALAPARLPGPSSIDSPQVFPANGPRQMRVALLNGCAQTVLDTRINEATVRLLTRHGVEVVVVDGAGCCGALPQHMGKLAAARELARTNIEAWSREIETHGLDHVVINTSGCGTTVKDYGFLFREDSPIATKAAHIASIARDVSEVVAALDIPAYATIDEIRVAYHAACSLQHGQKITTLPVNLLKHVGFDVVEIPEGHICCGSAGTYNILQTELADALRSRKVSHIDSVRPDVIAAGNLGCMIQIGAGTRTPILHTVELLDWATGGPKPEALEKLP